VAHGREDAAGVETIRFRTEDALTLVGELRLPDGPPKAAAVLSHAHPRHGGSKDHPIFWTLRIELARRSFAVLVFNFRGVMGSEGVFGRGVDEVLDLAAAVDRVRREADGPAFVAGWSFGAHVALRLALDDPDIGALALLGFPVAEPPEVDPLPPLPEDLGALDRPVLFVSGERDPYSPEGPLRDLAERLPGARVEIMAGTDHYFPRREGELAALVAGFAEASLLR
jgi:alpha/beta superfamily hydrolase